MKTDFRPILVVPAVPHDGGIRFLHQKSQIDLGSNMAEIVWTLLGYANGYNSIADIVNLSGLPEDDVEEIFIELREMELVVDSREQFIHFHRVSNYPMAFGTSLSQDEIVAYTRSERAPVKDGEVVEFEINDKAALYQIRENRRSCRCFLDKKLTARQIGNICHFAYSIHKHSVPSGGALYPLKIYVLIEKVQDGLGAGYYEYDAEKDCLVCFDTEVDEEQLKYCFNQEQIPFNSSVQIIIAADLKRQAYKYANRGYRLTLIEVGHVAENVGLYCAESGLGACEMGGVLDEPLKAELQLPDDVWPILAIPVGYPANSEREDFNKIRFVEENVGEDKAVKEIWAKSFDKDGSFFGATVTYEDGNGKGQFAGATSVSYADAMFKAAIEGYERWASGQVRVDFHGRAKDLKEQWLDPRLVFTMTAEQCKKERAAVFTEELPIDWTLGETYLGARIFVPTDIVYYGQRTRGNRIYFGHSSGIAAYSDVAEARKRALTELIERDALMRNWYTRTAPMVVGDELLPLHVKKRILHWKKKGRRLMMLQMPSRYGWVFEAVIASDEYPCFVVGAAATISEEATHEAMLKALMEAEYNLLLTMEAPVEADIDAENVVSPVDHGRFYYDAAHARTLNWLLNGEVKDVLMRSSVLGYDNLLQALNVTFVDLSREDAHIKVVRAFSTKLVPINFGSHTAHYTHPEIRDLVHPESVIMPHYFA